MHPKTIDMLMELSEAEETFSKLVRKFLPEGPVTLQFLGAPWEDDFLDWNDSLMFMGSPRTDIFPLAWMKCKLVTAKRLGLSRSDAYNGNLVSTYGEPTGVRVTFMLTKPSPSEVFTHENLHLLDV
jgi:hypothetical protein